MQYSYTLDQSLCKIFSGLYCPVHSAVSKVPWKQNADAWMTVDADMVGHQYPSLLTLSHLLGEE